MARQAHLEIAAKGVDAWNAWREAHPDERPDLEAAELPGAQLSRFDLGLADLRRADLKAADLSGTCLRLADIRNAELEGANLRAANLRHANLSGANLSRADLRGCDIGGANFTQVVLAGTDFRNARTTNTTPRGAVFADVDLSEAIGLETIRHWGPSDVSVSTLYKSGGRIPARFLQECGLPPNLISMLPRMIEGPEPARFYSCFISYSSEDSEFANHLYERMISAGLRAWFAPRSLRAGEKLHEVIIQEIWRHQKLLLVLSEHSMRSKWVAQEIREAKRREEEERTRILCPVRLTCYSALKDWKLFDADSVRDLAAEIREYFIPDFSDWIDDARFESSFQELLGGLKTGDSA